MDLETRVAAVEQGLAVVREQEIPVLHAETKKECHDARLESRGWAEFAVKANNKVDASSEVINLIYTDVRKLLEVQQGHGRTLDEHGSLLREHGTTLREHGTRLDGIDTRLDGIDAKLVAHDKRFDGIDARLEAHDKRFDRIDARLEVHDKRFDRIDARLADHGDILRKILAKVS
jgi:hypothetical protein